MGSMLTKYANTVARLDGKTAVITGANTGIGKTTAKDFYERGARVILSCRNLDKAIEAIEDIKRQCKEKQNLGELDTIKLDLSSLNSVRACANELLQKEKQINLLINNAGVMSVPDLIRTEDGNEMQLGINHLGHFLFTLLLLPKIMQSTPARIVNVSGSIHHLSSHLHIDDLNYKNRKYGPLNAYVQSKTCNILFTVELARRIKERNIEGINVYTLHPGVINTELTRYSNSFLYPIIKPLLFKTPEQGAQTQIYCAVSEKCANETGLYYSECKVSSASKTAQDGELAKQLWTKSLEIVGLDENYDPFKTTTNQ